MPRGAETGLAGKAIAGVPASVALRMRNKKVLDSVRTKPSGKHTP
jgi:hypothetical protein